MSRQSNKFNDITTGVEITLKEKTSVSINNDTENI